MARDGAVRATYRQSDFETRFTGAGFKFDFSAVTVANDAVADDKAKASSRADWFGGEERLEQVRLNIRRNTRAVVHYLNHQLIVFQAGADADFSGRVDRVNRVIDEIGPD